MQKNNFKNKRVLITGISGFVGKALEKHLNKLGAKVFGISRSVNTNNNILNSNILDYEPINKFVKDLNIQICFHLASESLVEEGQLHPYQTFKVNTEGTLNILEIARKNKLEKIIIASTSHVYGKNKVPYLETYMPRPTRPYETSKACTDLIAQSYAESFNLPVLIPRFVNIYGPGDLNFQRLIPKTINSVLKDSEPEMWGGGAVRDYLFIDDAIEAYLLLAQVDIEKVGKSRVLNFGSDNIASVEEIIKKIIKISGKSLEIKKVSEKREGEIDSQYVSFSKAIKLLGWRPKTGLDEGLKKTVDWYFRHMYANK